MKRGIILIILFHLVLNGMGQNLLHYPEVWMAPTPGPEKYYIDSLKKRASEASWLPHIHYRLNVGTSFTSGSWYGNGIQTWVAPEVNYQLNERWNFRAGVMISRNFPIQNSDEEYGVFVNPNRGSGFNFLIYSGADYKVNDKLILSADVMKSVAQKREFNYSLPGPGNFESYSFSLNYKLSKSMSIGANIRFNNGNSPFGYNSSFPYTRNYFGPPLFGY